MRISKIPAAVVGNAIGSAYEGGGGGRIHIVKAAYHDPFNAVRRNGKSFVAADSTIILFPHDLVGHYAIEKSSRCIGLGLPFFQRRIDVPVLGGRRGNRIKQRVGGV